MVAGISRGQPGWTIGDTLRLDLSYTTVASLLGYPLVCRRVALALALLVGMTNLAFYDCVDLRGP